MGYIGEHVLKAESVLGKRLPAGAVVHHVDENPHNNELSNLVVCQDNGYHRTLHRRWDHPNNLRVTTAGAVFHVECRRRHSREYDAARRAKIERELHEPEVWSGQ